MSNTPKTLKTICEEDLRAEALARLAMADFLEQWCAIDESASWSVSSLYSYYLLFCRQNQHTPLTSTQLTSLLKRLGFERYSDCDGSRWIGLVIQPELRKH